MNTARTLRMKKEAFDCGSHACGQTLYADELFVCNDCGCLFCEAHIHDVSDESGECFLGVTEPGSVYLCADCGASRAANARKGAKREMPDDDGRGFADEDAA